MNNRITFDLNEFKMQIERAVQFVPSKHVLPILTGILFEIKEDKCTIMSTDTTIEYSGVMSCSIAEQPVSFVLDAKEVASAIKGYESEGLVMDITDEYVRIRIKNNTYKINRNDADDFFRSDKKGVSLNKAIVSGESLSSVFHNLSKFTGANNLAGINISNEKKGELNFVATNGGVLSIATIKHEGISPFEKSYTIDADSIDKVSKLLVQRPIELSITGEDWFVVDIGNGKIKIATLDVKYPKYKTVLDSANKGCNGDNISFTESVSDTFKRMVGFINDGKHLGVETLKPKGAEPGGPGAIRFITSNDGKNSMAKERIECFYNNKYELPHKFVVSVEYFKEIFTEFGELVDMRMPTEKNKPVIIETNGAWKENKSKDGLNFTFVVMPMVIEFGSLGSSVDD